MEFFILTIIRITAPLLILRWPLFGVILASYIDYKDFDFLHILTNSQMDFYQEWDKILDTYYLALAWLTSLLWKDKIARLTSAFLFFYRFAGVFLVLFGIDRSLLLFFPNIFEWYFVFYLLFYRITKRAILFISPQVFFLVLFSVTIPKLAQEYFMHVLRNPPWQVFDLAAYLNIKHLMPYNFNASYWLWIIIFAILPFGTLYWAIKNASLRAK